MTAISARKFRNLRKQICKKLRARIGRQFDAAARAASRSTAAAEAEVAKTTPGRVNRAVAAATASATARLRRPGGLPGDVGLLDIGVLNLSERRCTR